MGHSSSPYVVVGAVCAVWALSGPGQRATTAPPHAVHRASSGMDTVIHAPGFDVSVVPRLMALTPDSVTLSYVVTVVPTTSDSLTSFMVDAPGILHVQAPPGVPGWWTSMSWHARPTAGWGADSAFVAPGLSTPPLTYSARGAVDIVRYWAEVDAPLDTVDTVLASDSIPAPPSADTAVTLRGTTGRTVGVGPMPVDLSPEGLAARLANLVTRACELGWVDDQGVCNSLSVKVRPDSGSLGALLNELDAQRGLRMCVSPRSAGSPCATWCGVRGSTTSSGASAPESRAGSRS